MKDLNCGLKTDRIVITQYALYVIKQLLILQVREYVLSHYMLKETNTKKVSAILIFLLRRSSKEIKQVFPLLQVALKNKVMPVRELIQ